YFEKIGEMITATSAISMTSPDRVVAPPQNHREGTGSRVRSPRRGVCSEAIGPTPLAVQTAPIRLSRPFPAPFRASPDAPLGACLWAASNSENFDICRHNEGEAE